MGTQRVQMTGVLPWWVRWACCAGTRLFCPALDASRASKKFFPRHTLFQSFVPIAQQAGQAVVLGQSFHASNNILMITFENYDCTRSN